MKIIIIIISLLLTITSCSESGKQTLFEVWKVDQKLRREIFMECLSKVPKGPSTTKYNDWDDVVDACGSLAYYMSKKCVRNCESIDRKEFLK